MLTSTDPCQFGFIPGSLSIRSQSRSNENLFHVLPGKCTELIISFKKESVLSNPIIVNGHPVESVLTAKILGVTVSNDLKWDDYIDIIIGKASIRLYLDSLNVPMSTLLALFASTVRALDQSGYSRSVVPNLLLPRDHFTDFKNLGGPPP